MSKQHKAPVQHFSFLRLADNSYAHIACIAFLVLLLYGGTLNAPFQLDETSYIVKNPIVKNLHYFSSPSDASGLEFYNSFVLRYIGYLTFALNYKIHGSSIAGYHIVNIAIHIANSVLVYLFVLFTFMTPFMKSVGQGTLQTSRKVAFFSGLLFAVHPLQTEAVTYVFQRFASLAAFFYLLSLVMYIKFRLMRSASGVQRPAKKSDGVIFYIISIISAVLAMKTKENAFTLPFVAVLYEVCFFSSKGGNRSMIERFRYLIPVLLTLFIIPATLGSLNGTPHLDPGKYGGGSFSRTDYLITQFRVIVTYLRLLALPASQNFDYDYPVFKSIFIPEIMLSVLFVAALFGLGIYLITKKADAGSRPQPFFKMMGFGILWFFITLSVESGIVPIPMLINEYRVYLPSVGAIICFVASVFMLGERMRSDAAGKSVLVMLIFVIGLLSVATHLRNGMWADDVKLWEDTVRKSPAKARTHFNLANRYASIRMYDEAIEQYVAAIKLAPAYAEAHNNLGSIYQDRGLIDKAMEQYVMAVTSSPGSASGYNNLGNIYQARNMPAAAEEQYLAALRIKPDFAEAHYNLGIVYQVLGMYDKAIAQYMSAISLAPDYVEAHNNLGSVYQMHNMLDKALEQYLLAVGLAPDFAEARFNLGLVYFKEGQIENARRELIECLKLKPGHEKAAMLLRQIP